MPLTTVAAWNRVIFAKPTLLKPNTDFFIVLDNKVNIRLPIMSVGTNNTHYHSGPNWSGPYTSVKWNYRILCCPAPILSSTSTPKMGQAFSIDLSKAKASTPVTLIIGVKQLNVALDPAGAPGCTLLTDPLTLVGLMSSATGTASLKSIVPKNNAVLGFKFYVQYAVSDPVANAMQFVFTNGGAGMIGN